MVGYWVARGSAAHDQQVANEYVAIWLPAARKYGAEVIAGKGSIGVHEGEEYPRQLIIRLSSF